MTSTCLSWIDTPCSRYTFWTSSTEVLLGLRMPSMSRIFFGSRGVFDVTGELRAGDDLGAVDDAGREVRAHRHRVHLLGRRRRRRS